MKIIIHHPYGADLVLTVKETCTIATLKAQVADRLCIAMHGHRLVRETVRTLVEMIPISVCELKDWQTLRDYSIPTGTALHLYADTPPKPVVRERY